MMNSLEVTVAIVTYNRARFLGETLATISKQNFPSRSWELLVVDNNSTDNTKNIVDSFAGSFPTLRYIFEGSQGLGFGRNRAIKEAKGGIVVFADDDILVEPNWLHELVEPLLSAGNDRVGIVGGEVVPIFPDGLPSWLEGAHRPMSYRSDVGPIPQKQTPMGANFAFRRGVFEKAGLFRTDLGRKGARLFGGEDTEIVLRARNADFEVWFAPKAKVLHQIPASRLSFGYASRHAFDSASSRVHEKVAELKRCGRTRWGFIASRLCLNTLKIPFLFLGAILFSAILRFGSAKKTLVRMWRCFGYIDQSFREIF